MKYDSLEEVSLQQLLLAQSWQAQYRLITDWGKLIQPKPELQQEQYLIQGCETPAWLAHQLIDNRHYFTFDSHSRVINGLVAIVLSLANGRTSVELAQLDIVATLAEAGLAKHLTPSRNNGLQKIIARVAELSSSH
ncbi:MAG TPA: SufE family protein [Cellvibrio sp.]|nr:SufE family protein [Cellvibrio sp.]